MIISIGIPAYNAEKYLRQTLESALAQTLTDWELLIVNDGSKDGTLAIAESYAAKDSRIRVLSQANAGVSAARNTAFAAMSPDTTYIIFMDADDLWEPEALEKLKTALDAAPESAAACGVARYIDGEGRAHLPGVMEAICRDRREAQGSRLVVRTSDQPTTFSVLAYRQVVATTGTLLIRREAMQKAGPFDTNVGHAEDWEMWLRLSLVGDFVFVDSVILSYRQHGANASGSPSRMRTGEFYVRRKLLTEMNLTPEQRAMVKLSFRLSERESFRAKLDHALSNLKQRQFSQAASQFARAMKNYVLSVRGIPGV